MEVFLSGEWGTVIDNANSYDIDDAIVVCRQLGYDTSGRCFIA